MVGTFTDAEQAKRDGLSAGRLTVASIRDLELELQNYVAHAVPPLGIEAYADNIYASGGAGTPPVGTLVTA